MSFLTAAPGFVTAAAGDLAGIGSALGEAHVAAALPTTGLVAAAGDEISAQIASLFGAYGQRYQALSAQAAAFHSEFVRLLNGGAAAYLGTELANAEQALLAGGGAAAANSAATLPVLGDLGGILGGSTGGGGLPPLTSVLGPINLGNLTPGLSLTGGPLGPILNGIGLDVGNFLSNELANGITLTNLASIATGLVQDVPLLQPFLPVLQSVLPGLFGQPVGTTVGAYPNPYVVLGETTVYNLNLMGSEFLTHPFPIMHQIASNQALYAHELSNAITVDLQNFPANVPANIQLALQAAASFNPVALGQTFVNGATGFGGVVTSSFLKFGYDIQGTLPVFESNIALANTAVMTGDYHGAVQDTAHALLGLFITGFDTSQLGITGSVHLLPLPPSLDISIAGPVGLLGPAGDLLPILTAIGQQVQGAASLALPGIPAQMAGNFANAIGAMTDAGVSAHFTVTASLLPPGGTLGGAAKFGLPLQLGFAILGPPFAGLDGLATGATSFSTAMQAGNVLGALNAIGDTPAFMLNGMINGQVLVDLPLPVTVDGITLPAIAHVPFDGILHPPEPLSVTIPLDILNIDIPINATLGGTQFGGLYPFLINTLPQQIASAIALT